MRKISTILEDTGRCLLLRLKSKEYVVVDRVGNRVLSDKSRRVAERTFSLWAAEAVKADVSVEEEVMSEELLECERHLDCIARK